MDAATSGTIVSWIDKNLVGTGDPRRNGKALAGEFAGVWRYRIGDFRILAKIEDKRLVILILDVRNRRNAYRR
jgi:mRNA interferase RelE/StbE